MSVCLWADPLNFAADQAEIEIYGRKKKKQQQEKWETRQKQKKAKLKKM